MVENTSRKRHKMITKRKLAEVAEQAFVSSDFKASTLEIAKKASPCSQ